MLQGSKSLDSKRFRLKEPDDLDSLSDENIKSQHIGKLFDDLPDSPHKISFRTRLGWRWLNIKGAYHDMCYRRRNRRVWCKTLNEIRPGEGFHGLLTVMQTHLLDLSPVLF